MNETITDIRNGIREDRFVNEAAVSLGIVQRILHELDWPTYDTTVVWPEFPLDGRRVDYALCHPPRKPAVFIEVKRVGQGVDADRQLFEYAFHRGVQLAVLTTGQEWHFFLPAGQGDYSERRVHMLDLLEREPAESVDRLRRYLNYRAVASGSAVESASDDYRNVARQREIRRTLPEAWQKLIEERNEQLCDLVAEKVESLCGFRPDLDTVAEYLPQAFRTHAPQPSPAFPRPSAMTPRPAAARESQVESTSLLSTGAPSVTFRGQRHAAANGRDVLVKVFQLLTQQDSSFPERFAAMPKRGKRTYLARSARALYPGSEHLARMSGHAYELTPGSGWWVDVHNDDRRKLRIIQIACEVAGLDCGTDLTVSLP